MSLSDQLIKSRRLRLPPAAVINAIRNSSRRQKRISKRINSGRSDIIGISRHINITDCQTYQKLLGPVYTSVPLSDNLLFFIDSLTNDLTDSEGESARHQRQATMTNRQFSELLNSLNICFQFITPESIARFIFSIYAPLIYGFCRFIISTPGLDNPISILFQDKHPREKTLFLFHLKK